MVILPFFAHLFPTSSQKGQPLKLALVFSFLRLASDPSDYVDESNINTMASQHALPLDERVLEGNLQFSLDLYKKSIGDSENGNVFISPFSISMAVLMTYAGAKNETAQEVKTALHFNAIDDEQSLHSTFYNVLKSLTSQTTATAPFQLNTANKMFLEKTYPIEESFKKTLVDYYLTDVALLNFISDSRNSEKEINNWVEEVTRNKIKDLIPSGTLNPSTRLVLANAIYFKGNWAAQFRKELTRREKFFRKQNDTVMVQFMNRKTSFQYRYIEKLNCKVLKMKYVGDRLSMIIVLPGDVDGLTSLENKLTATELHSLIHSTHRCEVKVAIPKFKLDYSLPLLKILRSLGINKLFSMGEADLTGISTKNDLYVSDCFHKAFVDVNEEGTEAAAATGMVLQMRSLPRDPEEFQADHPFLFLIYDNESRLILFIGRVTDPPTD